MKDEIEVRVAKTPTDKEIVEGLRKVLSKVVLATEVKEVKNEDGSVEHYLRPNVDMAEDFDVEVFSNLLDKLGFKLVKKEGN